MSTLRRTLKVLLIVIGVLVVAAAALALYIQIAGIPHYAVQRIDLQIARTPERVARGKKLVSILCVGCHFDPRTNRLSGHHLVDVPAKFGTVYSSNITQHRVKGIGAWSDGELAFLLRTGIARDGRYTPPWMIKLPHLADEDLHSIIAFLRSDDPLVAATDIEPEGLTRPSFLAKLLCRVAFKPLPYPKRPVETPSVADRVAYGRYLVIGLDCFGCHSASWETMNTAEPERSNGYLGGGNQLTTLRGKTIYSANITFDRDTGIGTWSEADLARALREGFRPDHTPLRSPMAPMPQLTEDEIGAIYAYLRTVPTIRNAVRRSREVDELRADASLGKRIYYKYACVSCHGDDGTHAADLRQAAQRFPTRAALRAWIEDAPRLKPGTRMPAWRGIIAEHEYEPLISYVLALGSSR